MCIHFIDLILCSYFASEEIPGFFCLTARTREDEKLPRMRFLSFRSVVRQQILRLFKRNFRFQMKIYILYTIYNIQTNRIYKLNVCSLAS